MREDLAQAVARACCEFPQEAFIRAIAIPQKNQVLLRVGWWDTVGSAITERRIVHHEEPRYMQLLELRERHQRVVRVAHTWRSVHGGEQIAQRLLVNTCKARNDGEVGLWCHGSIPTSRTAIQEQREICGTACSKLQTKIDKPVFFPIHLTEIQAR